MSSTPISKYIPSIEINAILSPIRTYMKEGNHVMSTDLFNKNHHNGQQVLPSSMTLEFSGDNNLNSSFQQFCDIHDTINMRYSNNSESHMYFIGRESKIIQTENDNITQSDFNNSYGVWSAVSFEKETKDSTDNTSVFYSLSPNVNGSQLQQSGTSSKTTHSKPSTSGLWAKMKQSFSNISFSDVDSIAAISNVSRQLMYNESQIIDDWKSDTESGNSQNEDQFIFSENSLSKVSNILDNDDYNIASKSYSSLLSFSEDENLLPNLTYNSHQLNQEKREFMEWSQDSFNGNNYENNSAEYNKIFEELSRSNSNEHFTIVSI